MKGIKDDSKFFDMNNLKIRVGLIKIRNSWREESFEGRN